MNQAVQPLYCAHSGFDGTPENSLESLYAGARAGYPFAEVDVRLTRDGQLVAHHDDRLTGPSGAASIGQSPYDELKALKPSLTLLTDLLRTAKLLGLGLNLDIKVWHAAEPAAALCRSMDMDSMCHFTGLELDAAREVAALRLPVRHMLNAPPALALSPDAAARAALSVQAFGINCHHQAVTRALVRRAHSACLWVWTWTVNDPARCQTLANMGVNGITRRVSE